MTLEERLFQYLFQLKQEGRRRERRLSSFHDRRFIHFDSNDYLSFSREMTLSSSYQTGFMNYPVGSTGSPFVSGYHKPQQWLEEAFARYLKVDRCVLLTSGYAANLAVTFLLGQLDVLCLIDKGIHASFYDGIQLSKITSLRFKHNDLDSLSSIMQSVDANAILITEGIFSMTGQMASLRGMAKLTKARQIGLIVDEAHSIGVIGTGGTGRVTDCGLTQEQVPLRVVPLGKAFGAQGAIIAGKALWIDSLLQAGRSMIYSTAMSPAFCYGLIKTLETVEAADERRAHLFELVDFFRACIQRSPHQWIDSKTPIQFLKLGCSYQAVYYASELKKQGIICSAIRPPTVSKQFTGLRVVINHHHTAFQIKQFFRIIDRLYEHSLG